jgi:hypothetical protein
MIALTDSRAALAAVERLSSIAVLIASLETLAQPQPLSDTGLCSWQVFQLMNNWTASRRFQRTVGQIFAYPRVLGFFALRAACAVLLLVDALPGDGPRAAIAAALVATSLLVSFRSPYGNDGADQMMTLIFVSTGLAHAIGSPAARQLALGFIALQACLSYFTAGIAKLASPMWRGGTAITGVLGTEIYGHPSAGALVAGNPALARGASWFVMLFECAFPLAIIGPREVTLALLFAAALFHLGAAIFMRLNTFLWAFVATYPAVLYSCRDIFHARW